VSQAWWNTAEPTIKPEKRVGPQEGESTFRWATITDDSPLTIRLDGDSNPLPLVPDTLVNPTTLVVSDRVWVHLFGRRVIVIGKAY
jgi:hypothetical protein